jgi:hypothetical protein
MHQDLVCFVCIRCFEDLTSDFIEKMKGVVMQAF